MSEENEEWIAIRRCVWIQEALVLRSLLEAEGIEVLLPEEYTLSSRPHYGIALGGARVMVKSSDLKQASAILDAIEVQNAARNDSDGEDG